MPLLTAAVVGCLAMLGSSFCSVGSPPVLSHITRYPSPTPRHDPGGLPHHLGQCIDLGLVPLCRKVSGIRSEGQLPLKPLSNPKQVYVQYLPELKLQHHRLNAGSLSNPKQVYIQYLPELKPLSPA
ncbi:hypothetical protein B0H14DRAFT_2633840 [Mycena olivaceomarginata]|nr:hypothetical protein B0H14DRAFT_2633840 [Mycena olivaceomarginata]